MTPSSVSDLILAMSLHVRVLFTILFDWSIGDLEAEYKDKD